MCHITQTKYTCKCTIKFYERQEVFCKRNTKKLWSADCWIKKRRAMSVWDVDVDERHCFYRYDPCPDCVSEGCRKCFWRGKGGVGGDGGVEEMEEGEDGDNQIEEG
jgi:hypothetical protein